MLMAGRLVGGLQLVEDRGLIFALDAERAESSTTDIVDVEFTDVLLKPADLGGHVGQIRWQSVELLRHRPPQCRRSY